VCRCHALAKAWVSHGGEALFASAQITAFQREMILNENWKLIELNGKPGSAHDAHVTSACAFEHECDCLVVDGYRFDHDFQKILRADGHKFLFFDDYVHCDCYCADIILNQNAYASKEMYALRAPETKLLLGLDYLLLRNEFLASKKITRDPLKPVSSILISMGGADPAGITSRVLTVLKNKTFYGINKTVILGGSFSHPGRIRDEISGLKDFELLVNTNCISGIMARSDIAVIAGGTTVWEAAFMQLPFIALQSADNQALNISAINSNGMGIGIGPWNENTAEQLEKSLSGLIANSAMRSSLGRCGRLHIDGNGADRVVKAVVSILPVS